MRLTLTAVKTVVTSNIVSEKLEIKQPEVNMAILALIHRLRVCRIMVILYHLN